MADLVSDSLRGYRDVAAMWVRAAMAYPVSFWMLAASAFVIGSLDFVGVWIIFSNVETLGGFGLREIALLYGATGVGLATADTFTGRVERLGDLVRTGRLDTMMVRPVPLVVQVCADGFAPRGFARIALMAVVLAVGTTAVDWTPDRVLLAVVMLVCSVAIFMALFVGFACLQFWTADASEAANAFTYGGNTITQYPLTIFPGELVKTLTFLLPLAFVNWYPCLHLLGRDDPFGMPEWFQLASPLAAALLLAAAALVWRTGVRHYTSTGS